MKFPVAVKAILIQLGSLFLCLLIAYILRNWFFIGISPFQMTFIDAFLALIITKWWRMDWWWRVIQFIFPLGIFLILQFEIPSHYYLCIFLFLVIVYWSTFRTRVPYYPSSVLLVDPILKLLSITTSPKFVDLGSGMGGLLIDLYKKNPNVKLVGVENAPLPCFISWLRTRFKYQKIQIFLKDFDNFSVKEFDVVFCYLSPAAMPRIWTKAQAEMKKGALLLSYEFVIHDKEPDELIHIKENKFLYVWRI